jgi:hypothetical protein
MLAVVDCSLSINCYSQHSKQQENSWLNAKFNTILLLSLALTLIQIVLGTDVREQVDIISKWLRQKLCGFKSNPSVLYSSFFFYCGIANFFRKKRKDTG